MAEAFSLLAAADEVENKRVHQLQQRLGLLPGPFTAEPGIRCVSLLSLSFDQRPAFCIKQRWDSRGLIALH